MKIGYLEIPQTESQFNENAAPFQIAFFPPNRNSLLRIETQLQIETQPAPNLYSFWHWILLTDKSQNLWTFKTIEFKNKNTIQICNTQTENIYSQLGTKKKTFVEFEYEKHNVCVFCVSA